jgi:hypothetical protein
VDRKLERVGIPATDVARASAFHNRAGRLGRRGRPRGGAQPRSLTDLDRSRWALQQLSSGHQRASSALDICSIMLINRSSRDAIEPMTILYARTHGYAQHRGPIPQAA